MCMTFMLCAIERDLPPPPPPPRAAEFWLVLDVLFWPGCYLRLREVEDVWLFGTTVVCRRGSISRLLRVFGR